MLFETSMGNFLVKLSSKNAPETVNNFRHYVASGFYDGLIFHRVIKGFMIQSGGYHANMKLKGNSRAPLIHERQSCGANTYGSISMARTHIADSAGSQFFINAKDNDFLNFQDDQNPGYCAFGQVVSGMDIVHKIEIVVTGKREGFGDVPVEPVVIKSARLVSQDSVIKALNEDRVADASLLDVVGVTLGYSASDDLSLITPVLSSGTTIPTRQSVTPRETLSTLHIVCQKPGNEPRLLATYRVEHTTQQLVTFDVDANGLLRVLSQGDLLGEPIPFYHQCL